MCELNIHGVWDGNVRKLGCDDHYTVINVIKFIELKKKKLSFPGGEKKTF